MVEFLIKPTMSRRKLAKQIIKAIDSLLLECNPHYELTLDIKLIEDQSKLIPEIRKVKRNRYD
jgi:hypothetical protein